MKKCIYCNKFDYLNESHVIPDSLSNWKIRFYGVCSIEHNAGFSTAFESDVINKFEYIRNYLDIRNEKGSSKGTSFEAEYRIGEIIIKKKRLTHKRDFYSGKLIKGEKNGKLCLFTSDINSVDKKILEKYSFERIDLIKTRIEQIINFELDVFKSEKMLRLAAKIAYEWYCKENEIYYKDEKYLDIINYILGKTSNDTNIVTIITNEELYKTIELNSALGGHHLGIYHDADRSIYVVFSFFGLVIYKIRIRRTLIDFNKVQHILLKGAYYDGTKHEIKIITNTANNMTSESSEHGLAKIEPDLLNRLKRLCETQIVTLKNNKREVEQILEVLKLKEDNLIFDELIGLMIPKRIFTVYILYNLGVNIDLYDYDISFQKNVERIISSESLIRLKESEIYEYFKQRFEEDKLFNYIEAGANLFMQVYSIDGIKRNSVR